MCILHTTTLQRLNFKLLTDAIFDFSFIINWLQKIIVHDIFQMFNMNSIHASSLHYCLYLTVTWLIVTYLMGSLRCTYKIPGKNRKKTSYKGPGIENAFSFCINSSDVIYFKVTIMGSVPPVFFSSVFNILAASSRLGFFFNV